MMNTSGILGGVYKISEVFSRLVLLNILWVFVNILVLFSSFNILIANPNDRVFFIMTTLLLTPFFFFPSMIALFAVVRTWIIDEDHSKVIRSFFMFLKAYYFKGLLAGITFSVVSGILIIDFYFLHEVGLWVEIILVILSLFVLIYTIHFFSIVVHYDISWENMLNKTLLLTIGNPISFLIHLAICAGLVTALYFFPLFLIIGTGVIGAYLSFSLFYKYYLKALDQLV